LLRVLGVEEGLDSFISHKPALPNLDRIREVGLETFLGEQRERRLLVERLLANYNEGRSMTFYCAACALMPPDLIRQAIDEMEQLLTSKQVNELDLKAKARAMRSLVRELASKSGIDLKLRKKRCRGLDGQNPSYYVLGRNRAAELDFCLWNAGSAHSTQSDLLYISMDARCQPP